jgi:hypothetical protein
VEGETIYVPAGWWHIVLNMDATVCVTQNVADPCHYKAVAAAIFSPSACLEAGAADAWRRRVEAVWPDLPTGRCVHCGGLADCRRLDDALEGRPVCAACVAARGGVGDEYELISSAAAEGRYALDLAGPDAPPVVRSAPHQTGHGTKARQKRSVESLYLHRHIRDFAVETHGTLEAAKAVAARYA